MRVIVASPNFAGYAVLVARRLTTLGTGATAGAVNMPFADTIPTVAFPPGMPFTDHTTVFGDSGTYAENCRVVPTSTVAVL